MFESSYLAEQFLIAMPGLQDSYFSKTVTLLCQHTDDGALGITINKASALSLGEVFQHLDITCEHAEISQQSVLTGGPVSPERGFVIHTPTEGYDSSVQIGQDMMITSSRDVLAAIAADRGPEQYVVALGYAGWTEGQLEGEFSSNSWLNVPADRAILFDTPLAKRWEKAVSRLGISLQQLHNESGHA